MSNTDVVFQGDESGIILQGGGGLEGRQVSVWRKDKGLLEQSSILPSLQTLRLAKKIKTGGRGASMRHAIVSEKKRYNLIMDQNIHSYKRLNTYCVL